MKKLIGVITLCCGISCAAEAQAPCSPIGVTVAEEGRVVTDLSATDFEVSIDGDPRTITSAKLRQTARFVLVLDSSGSMSDPKGGSRERRIWSMLIQTASSIVSTAPRNHSIGLVTFSDKVEALVPPTTRRELISNALDRKWQDPRPPYGKTSLWDALHSAVELFGRVQDGDFIVVISDGGDNASKTRIQAVQAELTRQHIRLFPVISLRTGLRTDEEIEGPRELQDLAENTGGAALNFYPWAWLNRSSEERQQLVGSLARGIVALSSLQYVLEFQSPQLEKPKTLRIRLAGEQRNRKKLKLLYQRTIGPCRDDGTRP